MDVRERMLKTFHHEEPDRVPSLFEGMMGVFKNNFMQKYEDEIDDESVLFGSFGDLTIYKYYNVDAVWLHSSPIKWGKLNIDLDSIDLGAENLSLNRHGHIKAKTKMGGVDHTYYLEGYLKTEELWKEWIDAGYFDFEISNDWIRIWEKAYPEALEGGIMLVPVDTTWEKIREAIGIGTWTRFIRKKPDFLKMLLDKFYHIYEESAKAVRDTSFEIVTWADDCAYKGNTMISTKQFEEWIVPYYKKINKISHEQALTFFHSDGYTEPFFNGLIEGGFDGIQSLEPAAGMDLKHLKDTYGDRVTLLGNIDVSRLLPFGTKQEIEDEVKAEIKAAAKGGGYVFSPCTDIIDSIPPENIKIMMDALLKYGKYPIQF